MVGRWRDGRIKVMRPSDWENHGSGTLAPTPALHPADPWAASPVATPAHPMASRKCPSPLRCARWEGHFLDRPTNVGLAWGEGCWLPGLGERAEGRRGGGRARHWDRAWDRNWDCYNSGRDQTRATETERLRQGTRDRGAERETRSKGQDRKPEQTSVREVGQEDEQETDQERDWSRGSGQKPRQGTGATKQGTRAGKLRNGSGTSNQVERDGAGTWDQGSGAGNRSRQGK